MGVSHLGQYAKVAVAAKANSGNADVASFKGGARPQPASVMPKDGSVSGYSKEALHAFGNSAKAHPKNGARVGAKHSQPKLGKKLHILNKTMVQPNGGRQG